MKYYDIDQTKSARKNVINVVSQLLTTLKVKVNPTTIRNTLEEHLNFPSLLSISDVLKSWRIENITLKIDKNNLKTLPSPFLVQIEHSEDVKFEIVKKISTETLIISDSQTQRWTTLTISDFDKIWKGIVMIVQAGKESGEINYDKKKKEIFFKRLPALLFPIAIIALSILHSNLLPKENSWLKWNYFVTIILKSIGCYVSYLLLRFEINNGDPSIQNICKTTKKVNCSRIIQSKASKIFNLISWSEIGFIYFSGGLFNLLLSSLIPTYCSLLSWLSLLAVPYTIFSIYYQGKVAKQWCLLCLIVQMILIIEFLINITGSQYKDIQASPIQVASFFVHFLFLGLIWLILKPFILLVQESKKNSKELIQLKYNSSIFESLLQKEPQLTTSSGNLGITLGNRNAKNKIIKVCNPYCGPCAKSHPNINELLDYDLDVQIQIIFASPAPSDLTDTSIIAHILAISEKKDEDLLRKALDDWYLSPQKDYKAFASKYPMRIELQDYKNTLYEMSNWCKISGIKSTPTIFMNGHKLPKPYKIGDLKKIIQ